MSASSGIAASDELKEAWRAAQSDTTLRCLKVDIAGERLVPGARIARSGAAEADYGLLEREADAKAGAYFLFRLDGKGWLLVVYVPDTAPVRQKMLYASTRAKLTKDLGDSLFTDSFHAHSPADLTSAAYRAHLAHRATAAPLTEREREAAAARAAEQDEAGRRGTQPRSMLVPLGGGGAGGKGMTWTDDAQAAVADLRTSREGAVLLGLDLPKEQVVLLSRPVAGAPLGAPADHPSYTLVPTRDAFVLVYCCPSKSPIKARMMYSAQLLPVVKAATNLDLKVLKRLETSDASEVTLAWVEEELGPMSPSPASTAAPSPAPSAGSGGFARPKRPGQKTPLRQATPLVAVAGASAAGGAMADAAGDDEWEPTPNEPAQTAAEVSESAAQVDDPLPTDARPEATPAAARAPAEDAAEEQAPAEVAAEVAASAAGVDETGPDAVLDGPATVADEVAASAAGVDETGLGATLDGPATVADEVAESAAEVDSPTVAEEAAPALPASTTEGEATLP